MVTFINSYYAIQLRCYARTVFNLIVCVYTKKPVAAIHWKRETQFESFNVVYDRAPALTLSIFYLHFCPSVLLFYCFYSYALTTVFYVCVSVQPLSIVSSTQVIVVYIEFYFTFHSLNNSFLTAIECCPIKLVHAIHLPIFYLGMCVCGCVCVTRYVVLKIIYFMSIYFEPLLSVSLSLSTNLPTFVFSIQCCQIFFTSSSPYTFFCTFTFLPFSPSISS